MAPDSAARDNSDFESHVRSPTTDKPNTKRVNFSVDSAKARVFKADGEDDKNTYLKVPISSLQEDRDGDEIADDGMDSLLNQVQAEPVGLFPNHGMDPDSSQYDFRNIFGAWEDADMDGDTTMGTVRLRRESADSEELVDNAEQLVDLIEQDMPVGFSIGFGWDEKDAEELDTGGYRFHDLDLMEISAVGIPSNPSAVVQAGTDMAAAMKDAGLDPTQLDADRLAKSLTETMSDTDTETEGEQTPDETDDTEQEQTDETNQLDEETLQSIQSTVMAVAEAHMDALVADIMDSLAEGEYGEDEEEETDEGDMDGDDEEDTEEEAGDGEDEDDKALEELRAELESVKSQLADSEGRKGGMTPADDKGDSPDETESDDDTTQTPPEEWAANLA